jgi:hypothetical protein
MAAPHILLRRRLWFRLANFLCATVAALVAASTAADAGEVKAGTPDELAAALRASEAGAIVQLADGVHETKDPVCVEGLRGTAAAPIIIRAEHRGRATIGGAAGFHLRDCEHVVIEGFVFTHDADRQAVLLENCRNVRITRNRGRGRSGVGCWRFDAGCRWVRPLDVQCSMLDVRCWMSDVRVPQLPRGQWAGALVPNHRRRKVDREPAMLRWFPARRRRSGALQDRPLASLWNRPGGPRLGPP